MILPRPWYARWQHRKLGIQQKRKFGGKIKYGGKGWHSFRFVFLTFIYLFIIDIGLGVASANHNPKISPSFGPCLFLIPIFVLISFWVASLSDHFWFFSGDLRRTRRQQFTARYGIREFSGEVRFRWNFALVRGGGWNFVELGSIWLQIWELGFSFGCGWC